jgi:cell division protein FtsI/penicillin-binding protein 2
MQARWGDEELSKLGGTRRRRMTLRGRMTIAGLALVLAAAVFALWPEGEGATAEAPTAQPLAPAPPAELVLSGALAAPPVSRAAQEGLELRGGRYHRDFAGPDQGVGSLRYTMDPDLSARVWRVLEQGRVALGHVLVMDVETGVLHVYASTDPERFSAAGTYPAASLVKVVTAAALMERAPVASRGTCRYQGSPYRLSRRRLKAPKGGREANLKRALATSNNQCFARWAIHSIGAHPMLEAIDQFGLLRVPAVGYPAGVASDPGTDELALGKLGSGLDGLKITPLHAVQLAASLANGSRVEPRWVDAAYGPQGQPLEIVTPPPAAPFLDPALTKRLRTMLIDTTRRGTARRAFRTRRGRPLLGEVTVAGKTGSLSGHDPDGRYEWFVGVAPADHPRVAVATVAVQGPLYWMSASQLAAEVLKQVFCHSGACQDDAADRLGRTVPEVAKGSPRSEVGPPGG